MTLKKFLILFGPAALGSLVPKEGMGQSDDGMYRLHPSEPDSTWDLTVESNPPDTYYQWSTGQKIESQRVKEEKKAEVLAHKRRKLEERAADQIQQQHAEQKRRYYEQARLRKEQQAKRRQEANRHNTFAQGLKLNQTRQGAEAKKQAEVSTDE